MKAPRFNLGGVRFVSASGRLSLLMALLPFIHFPIMSCYYRCYLGLDLNFYLTCRLSKTPNNAGFIDPSLAAPLGFTGRSLEDDVEIEYESSQDFGVEDSWQTGIIMSLVRKVILKP
jgi:hypothetical protein